MRAGRMRKSERALTLCAAATLALSGCSGGEATAAPAVPDLSGFQSIPMEPYLASDKVVYFKTPGGLQCEMVPQQHLAACVGALPGAPAGANQIVFSPFDSDRGLRVTSKPLFGKPGGDAPAVLPAGKKIAYRDIECAVGEGQLTQCVQGTPAEQWLVISPSDTGVGPPTPGLPPGYPDPNDFVRTEKSYVPGEGAKNIFPVFTVPNGLTCKMSIYSGGTIACGGMLPGVTNGDNEVYVELGGQSGTRKADGPPKPTYPGPVQQLPAGQKIYTYGATCMATPDGGVACTGGGGNGAQGFLVTATNTTTFGGT
jgi:hypothetical protein